MENNTGKNVENKGGKKNAIILFLLLFLGVIGAYLLTRDSPAETRAPVAMAPSSASPVPEGSPAAGDPAGYIDGPGLVAAAPSTTAVTNVEAKADMKIDANEGQKAAAVKASPDAKAPVVAAEPSASPRGDVSRVVVKFHETLPWLVATLIEVQIDGVTVAKSENPKGIGKDLAWTLGESEVKLGVRKLDVTVKLLGDSDAFPYLKDYTFTMKKTAAFPIKGPTIVRLEATPTGNATDDWTKRVNMEFHVERGVASR